MKPANKPIYIRLGDVHEIFFRIRKQTWSGTAWVDDGYQDLTGWQVRIQVRQNPDLPVLLTYTVTFGDQNDEVYGKGAVYGKLTGEQTETVPRYIAEGGYDIEVTDSLGDPRTFVAGKVTFAKDYTHD